MAFRLYDQINRAFEDLSAHKIDGVIYSVIPSVIFTKTFYPGRLKVATVPLSAEGVRLMALKNQQGVELINAFNQGLAQAKENGTYEMLIDRWGLIDATKF